MEYLSDDLVEALNEIALKNSIPFCYSCYEEAPTGTCTRCCSDDLMRLVRGVGVEYGNDWVIEHLISEHCTPADISEAFEDSIRGCYDETVQIGWIEYDVINAIKELDPVSWDVAESDWVSSEVSEGNLIEFEHSYYWLHDIETFVSEMKQPKGA